jgi:hypothetical protein
MIAVATAVILGATALWVLAPILGWTRTEDQEQDRIPEEQKALLDSRREILSSIKDLEMEYKVGKLTPEDYEETREHMTREAVEVLRRLDEGEARGSREPKAPSNEPASSEPSPDGR